MFCPFFFNFVTYYMYRMKTREKVFKSMGRWGGEGGGEGEEKGEGKGGGRGRGRGRWSCLSPSSIFYSR